MISILALECVYRMLYLVLAVFSSMMISVVMRLSEKHVQNKTAMLAVNYVVCCAVAMLVGGSLELFPRVEGLAMGVGLGAINGILFLAGFMLLQWNISRNGVVLPATFMKLGVLVPTIMAITVFGEKPGAAQIAGIVAAIAAIILIQGGGKQEAGSSLGLIILLLCGGSADAMSKIYEEIGPGALREQFLLYTFATALILCIVICAFKRQRIAPADLIFGALVSIPNYLSTRFLLLAVGEIPAVVAYPSYSVGTIIMVTLAGLIFFKEKLSRRKLLALGIILAALALLNL